MVLVMLIVFVVIILEQRVSGREGSKTKALTQHQGYASWHQGALGR